MQKKAIGLGLRDALKIEIGNVRAVSMAYVDVLMQTKSQPLFIPYCGEEEGGRKVLCVGGTHLQVRTTQGWRPVRLKTTNGVLAAYALTQGVTIPVDSKAEFTYKFMRRFFQVEPGQKLRVVVDAWHNKESMVSGHQSIAIASPSFECPQIAFE